MSAKKKQPSSLAPMAVAALHTQHHTATAATAAFAVSAFSPSAAHFAAVSQQLDAERLSVWDTRTSQLVVSWPAPNKIRFSCVGWGYAEDHASEAKKKRRRKSDGDAVNTLKRGMDLVVAAGTSSGEIVVHSVTHGRVVASISTGVSSPVTSFAFHNSDPSVAYSVSQSGDVFRWDMLRGASTGHFKVAANLSACQICDGSLVIAGHQLRLYDAEDAFGDNGIGQGARGLSAEFTGHAASVSAVRFIKGGAVIISSAVEDRFVSVWDAERSGGSVASLTLESPPTLLAVSEIDHVLALTELGVVNLWSSVTPARAQKSPGSKKSKTAIATIPAESSIRVSSLSGESKGDKDRKPLPILAASFVDEKIIIAYGSTIKPTFERVAYQDADGTIYAHQNLTRVDPGTGLLVTSSAAAASALAAQPQPYREATSASVLTGDPDVILNNEPSMEERLKAMALEPSTAPAAKSAQTTSSDKPKPPRRPTASSLHAMLAQAVHSNDRALLEAALAVSDNKTIAATVRRLPAAHIAPFLKALLTLLQARPNRAARLAPWLGAVAVAHSAHLIADPASTAPIAALCQTLDARASTHDRLMKLGGRLDLVVKTIAMRSEIAVAAEGEEIDDNEAEVVWDEAAEDEEDLSVEDIELEDDEEVMSNSDEDLALDGDDEDDDEDNVDNEDDEDLEGDEEEEDDEGADFDGDEDAMDDGE